MPVVGERKSRIPGLSAYKNDPMAAYSKQFLNEANSILNESRIDMFRNPLDAITLPETKESMRRFFVEESADIAHMNADEIEDHETMMNEMFLNDIEGIHENAAMAQFNPVVGMTFPIHKNLMMNCVFTKAIPNFVASSPKWTETMETRWMIHPVTGEKIDFWKEQWKMSDAIRASIPKRSMFIPLPEAETTNLIQEMFNTTDPDLHLSIQTNVTGLVGSRVAYPGQKLTVVYETTVGGQTVTQIGTYINDTANAVLCNAGASLKVVREDGTIGTETLVGAVFEFKGKFAPSYGYLDRSLQEKFTVAAVDAVTPSATLAGTWDVTIGGETIPGTTSEAAIPAELRTSGFISGYLKEDKIGVITSVPNSDAAGTGATTSGVISGIILTAQLDTSTAKFKSASVTWSAETVPFEIPEAPFINVPITPEEVKDIAALYQIQQLTKVMSLIKTSLENYKDDCCYEGLNESFKALAPDQKLARQIDFAPQQSYALDPLTWRKVMFMDQLDTHVTQLLHILNDPNMTITIVARDDLIRKLTPTDYTYQTPSNIGPVELDYVKTVCTSDKRTYQFITSDKLRDTNNMIVLLNPRNTNRFMYRLYDYQMYVSNEIRNASNPTLPAVHAFERWQLFEYQPVQARIRILNPTGLRNYATDYAYNLDPIGRGDGVPAMGRNDFDIDAI